MGLYPVQCPQCHKTHLWFSGNPDQRCEECIKKDIKENSILQGWQCPICKTVYSPFVTECPRCIYSDKHIKITVDSGTGTIVMKENDEKDKK